MDLVPAVVADEQPLEVVQPGEGSFDDPADAAEAGAVLGLASSDVCADAASSEFTPVLVVVVAAIGDDSARSRLPPVTLQASGIPDASTRR